MIMKRNSWSVDLIRRPEQVQLHHYGSVIDIGLDRLNLPVADTEKVAERQADLQS